MVMYTIDAFTDKYHKADKIVIGMFTVYPLYLLVTVLLLFQLFPPSSATAETINKSGTTYISNNYSHSTTEPITLDTKYHS